jgi:hypothetical protein
MLRRERVLEDNDLLGAAGSGTPHDEGHVGWATEGVDKATAMEVDERWSSLILGRGGKSEEVEDRGRDAELGCAGSSNGAIKLNGLMWNVVRLTMPQDCFGGRDASYQPAEMAGWKAGSLSL